MGKILSILIPTRSRYEYLKRTLEQMIPQIERNIDEVELVVCCNASKDETDSYMKEMILKYPFIRYRYFDEYVEVGESLIRSVDESHGEYVVLWGDDDIPHPYFIETILDVIRENSEIAIIHCNRLFGKDGKYGIKGLAVQNKEYDKNNGVLTLDELLEKYSISLGFISSLVFRHDCWEKGKCNFSRDHYGYEHLSIIISGSAGRKCYYCSFPLEIQRHSLERDFTAKWPLYHFIGVPNMMKDFDRWGITSSALERWNIVRNSSFILFLWNMMFTSLDKKRYKPICHELNKYQSSVIRRCLTYLIVWGMPTWLFKMLRDKLYSK